MKMNYAESLRRPLVLRTLRSLGGGLPRLLRSKHSRHAAGEHCPKKDHVYTRLEARLETSFVALLHWPFKNGDCGFIMIGVR